MILDLFIKLVGTSSDTRNLFYSRMRRTRYPLPTMKHFYDAGAGVEPTRSMTRGYEPLQIPILAHCNLLYSTYSQVSIFF